jgi:hypothetical protein
VVELFDRVYFGRHGDPSGVGERIVEHREQPVAIERHDAKPARDASGSDKPCRAAGWSGATMAEI